MNDPIRYTGKTEGSVLGSPHWEHPEGEWVKYEDYEELKAQGRRMAMESIHDLNHIGGLQEENAHLHSQFANSEQENARLKAEVERLRKAGDAMASSIQFNEEMAKDYNGPTIVHQSIQRWTAAKEGKPSV